MSSLAKRYQNLKSRYQNLREENAMGVERVTRTVVTGGGAFGMAWYQARFPDRAEVFGAPASLVVGGGLAALAYMGYAGEQESTVEALSNGCIAVFACDKGREMGEEQLAEAA